MVNEWVVVDMAYRISVVYMQKYEKYNTLEKLTLNRMYVDITDILHYVEDCIQRISKAHNTKDIPNLRVNISCVNH